MDNTILTREDKLLIKKQKNNERTKLMYKLHPEKRQQPSKEYLKIYMNNYMREIYYPKKRELALIDKCDTDKINEINHKYTLKLKSLKIKELCKKNEVAI